MSVSTMMFIAACLVLICMGFAAARPKRPTAEFDGGWSHENDLRITRIRSPHIITKGD